MQAPQETQAPLGVLPLEEEGKMEALELAGVLGGSTSQLSCPLLKIFAEFAAQFHDV